MNLVPVVPYASFFRFGESDVGAGAVGAFSSEHPIPDPMTPEQICLPFLLLLGQCFDLCKSGCHSLLAGQTPWLCRRRRKISTINFRQSSGIVVISR
jgi:hypothetical protein